MLIIGAGATIDLIILLSSSRGVWVLHGLNADMCGTAGQAVGVFKPPWVHNTHRTHRTPATEASLDQIENPPLWQLSSSCQRVTGLGQKQKIRRWEVLLVSGSMLNELWDLAKQQRNWHSSVPFEHVWSIKFFLHDVSYGNIVDILRFVSHGSNNCDR